MYTYAAGSKGTFGYGTEANGTKTPSGPDVVDMVAYDHPGAPLSPAQEGGVVSSPGWTDLIAKAVAEGQLTSQRYPIKQTPYRTDPRQVAAHQAAIKAARAEGEAAAAAAMQTSARGGLLTNPFVIAGALVAAAILLRRRS